MAGVGTRRVRRVFCMTGAAEAGTAGCEGPGG